MENKKLINKTALITGASSGLGYEIASSFIKQGANIIICARKEKPLKQTVKELNKIKNNDQKLLYFPIDISNTNEVDYLIAESYKTFTNIEILINNAGIIGPKGEFEKLDWDSWQYALNINFLGSAYLIKKLMPKFKENNYGRIVQISGGGATSPLPYQSIYAASKAAIVRFIETIALEVESYNITANCIAPGQLNTKILKEYLNAGQEKLGHDFYKKVLKQYKSGGAPINKAVDLALALSSEEMPYLKGKLISAIWDDWENINEFYDELNNSDVYTLRRIVAKDRFFNWGDL